MRTVDTALVRADTAQCFAHGADVERWPEWLPHYRRVRYLERRSATSGVVEMAAVRPFGPLGWPTWWVSEMTIEPEVPRVRYRHVRGITTGMDVAWDFTPEDGGTRVTITHWWDGPRWPLIGRFAADAVIGPVFVHGIASRTLAGIARAAERSVAR
jgi:ribosome-associated toxin RatA of RatAB toxin-antitoxin module